jgi:hypothetical protein
MKSILKDFAKDTGSRIAAYVDTAKCDVRE